MPVQYIPSLRANTIIFLGLSRLESNQMAMCDGLKFKKKKREK
jgi:hypothetical protein